ncbi:tail fiber domain-containing protein, partial [Patescibacteria group bacterium]|nr:tail fiber domain-containing protein [Patescibacteria group bacterium]
VGIGTTGPNYQLELSTDSAGKPTSGTWAIVSDARLKTNISDFTDGLSIIKQINPVNYTLNGLGGTPEGAEGISVIAQDIMNIAPYTIRTFNAKLYPEDATTTELYSFDASALTFVAINAIKELNIKIEDIQAQIGGTSSLAEESTSIFDSILAWLRDKVLAVKSLFVSEEICIDDVCINKAQLSSILEYVGTDAPSETLNPIPQTLDPNLDTESPTLTLMGNNPAEILVNSEYHDMGVTVTDNVDINLGYEVWLGDEYLGRNLTGTTVDTSEAREWSISYVATDQAGNTATTTRMIEVRLPNVDIEPPLEVQPLATTTPETPPEAGQAATSTPPEF